MTVEQILERMRAVEEELEALRARDVADGDLNASDDRRFNQLIAEHEGLSARHGRMVAVERAASTGTGRLPGSATSTGTDSRSTSGPAGELRDQARRSIDEAQRDGRLPAHAAERAEQLVTSGPVAATTYAARWAVLTGDPAYARAFYAKVAAGDDARDLWTDEERAAWQRVAAFQAEQRAMTGGTDSAGGFMVPTHLDPAILLTSDGSINPLRQISRVVTIASDTWNGVSSAGVTAAWYAEEAEVTDDAPTLAGPSIPTHRGSAFVPYSFEVGQDGANFAEELGRLLTDAADVLQATAYTTGSGTGEPTGVITALPAGSIVTEATNETFTAADVYAVQEALPPRFQGRARWNAQVSTINDINDFETTNGAKRFPEVGAAEPTLLRHPLHENSDMDAAADIDPAANADNKILLYGDFSNFVIVDRIGTTVELVPHLFGTNRRPTGQRGLFMWFRSGSDVVVDEAFRVLNVTTSTV